MSYRVWRKRNENYDHPLYYVREEILDECEKRIGEFKYSDDELWCLHEVLEHLERIVESLEMEFNAMFYTVFVRRNDAWVAMDDEFAEGLLHDAACILCDVLKNEAMDFVAEKRFSVLLLQQAKKTFYKARSECNLFTKWIYSRF
jgi:hypothetical protein